MSTISDHVAPWRSVYKVQALTDADVTFVLSNGGHNAEIVNPPGRPNRKHQIAAHAENENYINRILATARRPSRRLVVALLAGLAVEALNGRSKNSRHLHWEPHQWDTHPSAVRPAHTCSARERPGR